MFCVRPRTCVCVYIRAPERAHECVCACACVRAYDASRNSKSCNLGFKFDLMKSIVKVNKTVYDVSTKHNSSLKLSIESDFSELKGRHVHY